MASKVIMKRGSIDNAYDSIRGKILSGKLPPGHALMTDLMAKEITASRTLVREALRKLEADGLVTIRPHVGARVKKMQLKEYREMCDLAPGLGEPCRRPGRDKPHGVRRGRNALCRESHAGADQADHLAQEQAVPAGVSGARGRAFQHRRDVRGKKHPDEKEIFRFHLTTRMLSRPGSEPVPPKRAETNACLRVILAKHNDIDEAITASNYPLAKKAMEAHIQEMIEHWFLTMARTESGAIARELTPEEWVYRP